MFIIELMLREEFDIAIKIIGEHRNVSYAVERDGYTFVIIVNTDADKHCQCEKVFENNWHQKHGSLCCLCEQKGEQNCEHRTFTRPIRAVF